MDEAKSKIKQLIEKYEAVLSSGQVSKYSEEETKKGFIEPLFIALGWDISNKNETTAEESQLQGRVDYGFYLEGRIKFYLEAKPLRADLHNEEYAKQAIRYSWNKGVDWAVLTDFESLKVFYCQDPTQSLFSKLVFEISFNEYLERLSQLWLLSKQSFQEKELDTYAREHGKMMQKISVGDQLYKHLNESREILISKLGVWNGIKDQNLLEEGVQKLLDRLVFIRVAEDRGIEPPTLIPLVRAWGNDKKGKTLYESMITKFRELDSIYNSNLFIEHPFEKWNESPGITEEVIKKLQGKGGYYEYDFKVIPADVLGAVYENYLGYKLAESQKGVVLDKSAKKRKEQGIYYTPEYIVDYIVRNTLKPILDKCKTIGDLQKIKVLDPACGSGSFLIKALEVINEKYKEFGNPGNEYTKIMILQQNIYGVDLDEQAVEIARLNLLINTLETRVKLPKLDKNIKNGNSLISGTEEDLKKYFGENYRDKKPFNWEEEFPEVFKQGGFDVIIGNPPWVFTRGENFSDDEKKYFNEFLKRLGMDQIENGREIQSGKLNLYSLFILRSIQVLKNTGSLGFIIPNNILRTTTFDMVRKFLLDSTSIKRVVDLGEKVFHSVTASSVILILDKENNKNKRDGNKTKIISNIANFLENKYNQHEITQQSFYENPSYAFNILADEESSSLSIKVEKDTVKLGLICQYIIEGIVGSIDRDVVDKRIDNSYKPFLVGKDIGRYKIKYKNKWICYDKKRLHRARPEEVFLSNKIILQRISGGSNPLVATLDRNKYYTFASINNILIKKDSGFRIEYVLGLINSKLINWYYSNNFSNRSKLTVNISKTYLEQLPIIVANEEEQKLVIDLVNKILDLNKELLETTENSNKWNEIKSEIEKVDKKIDEKVYKLYGLTLEEIAIVENISYFVTKKKINGVSYG